MPEQQRVEDLQVALLKLPKIHLVVLDAIVEHLRKWVVRFAFIFSRLMSMPSSLIDSTQEVDESPEVYTTKLGLSLGRSG